MSNLSDAYARFIQAIGPWDWYATLTFREPVHPEQAVKRCQRWLRVLSTEVYGRRFRERGLGCWWVRSLEYQRRDVIHFHMLLGGVGTGPRRKYYEHAWHRENGFASIFPYDPLKGARYYCAKYVTKKTTGGEIDVWLSERHKEEVVREHAGELEGLRVDPLLQEVWRKGRL